MTKHKRTIEDLKSKLLDISDSLGVAEETLWNLFESPMKESDEEIQVFIYHQDQIWIPIEECFTLFHYIQTLESLKEI